MPIEGYRVIYNENIYKVLSISPYFKDVSNHGVKRPDEIECIVMNIDGDVLMIKDEAFMFKLVKE